MEGMGLVGNLTSHGGDVESCYRATTKKPDSPAGTTEPVVTDSTASEVPAKDYTTPDVPAEDTTTREVESNWSEKIISFAPQFIEREIGRLKPRSWDDRQGLHEAVANGFTEHLNNFTNNKNYAYEALAYLPYADDERHAFVKLSGNLDVVRNEHKSVNYVVSRRRKDTLGSGLASQWSTIEKNASGILEAMFSTRATNLARRMEEVTKRFGPFLSEDGFRAVVALRCGYKFVWYELGYRYFPAGYATGKHTLFLDTGNKYSDKCGQIVFFP